MATPRTGRPRGRPKGSKNVPSISDFVVESLTTDIPVPTLPPRPKGKPRGIWANMTPEQRSEHAKSLQRKRRTPSPGRPAGLPYGMSLAQKREALAAQKPIIDRIMQKMSDKGQLPDDPMAVEALRETITVLRTPQITAKDKLAAARLILDFTKAKPSQKIEHTVKTAEDYLDELADD